jgi:virginiamycin B lyase
MGARRDRYRGVSTSFALIAGTLLSGAGQAASGVGGYVFDLNGRPLEQAMVTIARQPGQAGPAAVTVFTDEEGRFRFPQAPKGGALTAQLLGYRMIEATPRAQADPTDFRIIMRADANQAGTAPASAWLAHISDSKDKAQVVMTCVACHQMPSPEVRAYAKLMHDVPSADRAQTRQQGWHAVVQYMNYISAWEFGRGVTGGTPDPNRVYSGGEAAPTAALLAKTMIGPLQEIEGYKHGAPLLVNARTVIREYEVPAPNAVREAITLDDPRTLWLADVSSNRVIRVDTESGALRNFEVPAKKAVGPHTLVRGRDGALWVAPFFNGIVARLDPKSEQWKVWPLSTGSDTPPGVHDLTFGSDHDLMTDKRGRVWFSDIVNNGVGWFDPKSGKSGVYKVPPVPGRAGRETLYGIAMESDQTRIWYSQLGVGSFGSFNVETLKFETSVQLPDGGSGPRRITVSDQDVLYVPLYGSGQLAEYDTRAHKMIGIYDLPDRASAPYAVTWDPVRKVVWIPTSNANAIYRFDPRDKSFAVLPMPREGAFLRMLSVDKKTGALTTAYGNIVEYVHGPRMAAMIDPGDRPAGVSP